MFITLILFINNKKMDNNTLGWLLIIPVVSAIIMEAIGASTDQLYVILGIWLMAASITAGIRLIKNK